MTFLPIVERELRVAARRRGTYGLRLRIAGVATLAFAACFAAAQVAPSFSFSKTLFWGLSGLCMLYCLSAGRLMTADCLSREKREGTLGLLFLTDLKGYDVVLGKLAATSLNGFYGLLAVFPLLAIPLLSGGMTNGELWRMALVLVNTFLFSLAIGIFVSAISRDEQKAMGANFGMMLLLVAALPVVAGMLMASTIVPGPLHHPLMYSCPVYTLVQCADMNFGKAPGHFWTSLGVTLALSLFLVLLACWAAPHAWQDKPLSPRVRKRKGERRWRWWREGRYEKSLAFRRRVLAMNAYCWLTARPYLKVSYVWTAVFLVGCCWGFTTLMIGHLDDSSNYGYAFILNAMLKMWVTAEAGHQLAEDKRSGAFELLLSTPLSARDIIQGQWLSLRRQFLKPVVVAVILELVLMCSINYYRPMDRTQARCLWAAGLLMLLADLMTLGWVAMSEALVEKSHGRATAKAAAFALALPWILFIVVAGGTRLWVFLFFRTPWEPDWTYDLMCWFGLGIVVDTLLLLKARRRLETSFRQFALETPSHKSRLAWLWEALKGDPETKSAHRAKLRRVAIGAAVGLATGAGGFLYVVRALQVAPPKPLVVSLSQSNNPVRVFSSQAGFLFILPDGSLWRWLRPVRWRGQPTSFSPPERIGTNLDWVQASANGTNVLGVRSDGSLWAWHAESGAPKQVGTDTDWVEGRSGGNFSVALKRNGTLWAWGDNTIDQLGNGPGPNRREPAQMGTNRDWKALSPAGYSCAGMALSAEGTLWAWGGINYFSRGTWSHTTNPVPMQVCRESNWEGFLGGPYSIARNREGHTWSFFPFTARPDADVPVGNLGFLMSSNATSVAFGAHFATNWSLAAFETRSDGTLWGTRIDWPPAYPSFEPPRRFGGRSDWIAVWGNYMTSIGLTADGTICVWGLDKGQEQHLEFGDRLGVVKRKISEALGTRSRPGAVQTLDDEFQGYQPRKEPRPLFRLVFTNSAGEHSPSPQ